LASALLIGAAASEAACPFVFNQHFTGNLDNWDPAFWTGLPRSATTPLATVESHEVEDFNKSDHRKPFFSDALESPIAPSGRFTSRRTFPAGSSIDG
jgi:hypothetical protein